MIYNGHVPRIDNHYQHGRMGLPVTWTKEDFHQATRHWESLVFFGYNAHYDNCSMRGDDLEEDLKLQTNY